ncbi:MAG TPA: type IV secretion system DNA-binding domain-containing protein [Candidatus Methylomirabilis sp.]|nr:type IV secretion system DNA-binding domain-containing protein [Candidatus Methylomirabilis sp.]
MSPRQERIVDAVVRFLEDPWRVLGGLFGWLPDAVRLLIGAAAAALVVIIVAAAWRAWRDRRIIRDARRIRILPPGETDPSGAGTLWMGLHALLRPWWRRALWGQPYLAWEITARPEQVEVSMWVPRSVPPGLVERAVEVAWPGARTAADPDDPLVEIARAKGVPIETSDLVLAEPEWFPVGGVAEDNPLSLAHAALGALRDQEAAAIQVLARPVTARARLGLRRAARALRAGGRPSRLAWRQGRDAASHRPAPDPSLEADVRAILVKAASPLWRCLLRVVARSPERPQARGRIHALAGAFALFEGRNGFRRRRVRGGLRAIGERRLRRPYLLSVPELAQIATLPGSASIPGLERAAATTVPAPRELPRDGKVLGIADHHAGIERAAAISVEDARHHIHVIGETGTGKSTLLAQLVLQDAALGRSAVVIDPKGDLVNALLERLPPGSEERTCVIDPEDRDSAVGLDVLAGDDPDLVVDHVLGVFKRIYEPWWGPRTDDVMRAACLTLTRTKGATLAEIPLLLTDPGWRMEIRDRLATDATGLATFWRWYERIPEAQRAQHIAPLLNKLRAFLLRGPVRAIVGQSSSRLDIPALLDTGGLLLVRIPKGTLGEETSRLLGAFVIARVWQACMRRASVPEEDRPDTALYVDEMHNYLVLPRSFEDLLAEARGYRLALVLAHQHMGQLNKEMREALAANARTKLVFTCSPEDAFFLQRHFAPELNEHDLSRLATYQAACRPCIGAGQGAPFTLRTTALPAGSPERARAVRDVSAAAYGRDRDSVEEEIWNRQRQAKTNLLPEEPKPKPPGGSEGGSAGASPGGSRGAP